MLRSLWVFYVTIKEGDMFILRTSKHFHPGHKKVKSETFLFMTHFLMKTYSFADYFRTIYLYNLR